MARQSVSVLDQRIYDSWIPKLKEHYKNTGVGDVSESKLRKIAKMCHTRAKWDSVKDRKNVSESATFSTLANTPGRGAFSFGNNPANGADHSRGSGEVFDRLFSVFVDAAATTYGMDLLPILTMNKSNILMVVAEPIYAGGKLDATTADDKPLVFSVELTPDASPAPDALVIGTDYTVGSNPNTTVLTYVGKDRVKGHAIFKLGAQAGNHVGATLAATLTSASITVGGGDYDFVASTLDYVNGFLNVINGFGGAGKNDTGTWYANRNTGGTWNSPMSRETGEKTYYRQMGVRTWSRNFSAETFHTDIAFTTEQIQDYKMDHDMEATAFGDTILQDQLSQWMNEHILGTIYANGWTSHYEMNKINPAFNMNIALNTTVGSAYTFMGNDGITNQTIAGAPGALPTSGAISENLSTLQRRLVTRMNFGTAVVKSRCRFGRGNTASMNAKFSSAVKDIRGYAPATFPADINDNGVAHFGEFYGIQCYEDTLADLTDPRVAVWYKNQDSQPGLYLATYLLSEKIETIAERTMSNKQALKSRYVIAAAGSNPQLNFLTFCCEEDSGYTIA